MRFRSLLAVLCVAPLLANTALAKDDLVIGVAQFPSALHPNIDSEVIKAYVVGFAVRQITAFDKDWKNACLLCTELPTIANGLAKVVDLPGGGRGMEVTIKLKPDLKWGDGHPVTARDIAFTWKLARDPASGFSNSHPWDRAKSLDIIDDHTVVLHLDRVLVAYNQWDQILPEHIEAPIAAANTAPGAYIKATAYNSAPTTPGLWDGPYMVTGYESGTQIVFGQNPNWAGPKPGFKHIVIKLIGNTAALQANLLSGDVDMAAGEGVGLTIDQVLALKSQYPDKFNYVFKPSLTYEHINLQRDNPIFSDLRVRQAMLMALDRKTLTDKLFGGMQPVAATWVNPLDANFDKSIRTYPFDLPGARKLLTEAGWTPGPDGICRNPAGQRLSIEFSTTAGNKLRELTQQVLQNQWKAACVEVTIKNEPPRSFFGETVKKRLFTGMAMFGWSSGVGDSPRRTLGSDNIPTAANSFGGANYVAFSDPKMDADIAAAETELDPEKLLSVWADMQRIYVEQLPVLPLFFRAEPHVFPKWLKGYEPTGHTDYSSMRSENWQPG